MTIIALFEDQSKMAQITGLALGGVLSNGTGVVAAAPVILARGANTITVATAGTVIVTMPTGSSASVASAGGTVSPSPTACPAGASTAVNVTVAGTITVTVTVNATAATIEIPGIRTILAVVGASLSGGYKVDPAAVTVAGNKVTIQPQYYAYNTGAASDNPAINVPTTVDLSAILCNLTVIGY
jgi:hypothetical protein